VIPAGIAVKVNDLLRHAVAVAGPPRGSAAVVNLEAADGRAQSEELDVELSVGKEHTAITSVTVRARRSYTKRDRGMVEAAIEEFGGADFVSLAMTAAGRANAFELCFWFRLPLLAHNDVVLPRLMSMDQLERYQRALDALGIEYERSGSQFAVPARQWRKRPSAAELAEAFSVARGLVPGSALYCAPLPFRQSVRLLSGVREGRAVTDCSVTCGPNRRGGCQEHDLERLSAFAHQHWDVSLLKTSFRVRLQSGAESASRARS
jgi:hypothetical protein